MASYLGISNLIGTDGTAPGAITPTVSTAPGDVLIFFHYSKINAVGTQTVTPPTGFTSYVNSRDANGLICVATKLRVAGETTYTATTAGHVTGTSGDTTLEFIETWRGASPVLRHMLAAPSTWVSSTSYGPIAVQAGATVARGANIVFFAGREENVTIQTVLTGDTGLTWNARTTDDSTAGADASAVTQSGANKSAAAVTPTAKTITSTGTAGPGKGVSFVVYRSESAYDNVIDVDNPISHWKFGESLSNFFDRYDVRTATATNTPIRTTGILPRNALANDADGAFQNDTGDKHGSAASDTLYNFTTALSVELWTKPNTLTGSTLLSKSNAWSLAQLASGFGWRWGVVIAATFENVDVFGPAEILPVAGVVYHVVGTYDGQTMRLYLNGVEVGSVTRGSPSSIDTAATPITISGAGGAALNTYDEAAVYATCLSPDRVMAHYRAGALVSLASAQPASRNFLSRR